MGNNSSRSHNRPLGSDGLATSHTQDLTPHSKVFQYICDSCHSRRPIEYVYVDGKFVNQAPRALCGKCGASNAVQPYLPCDCQCPQCSKVLRIRLPAQPVDIQAYSGAYIECVCGFKGDARTGQMMRCVCMTCGVASKELSGVFSTPRDTVEIFCKGQCQSYRLALIDGHVRRRGSRPGSQATSVASTLGSVDEMPADFSQMYHSLMKSGAGMTSQTSPVSLSSSGGSSPMAERSISPTTDSGGSSVTAKLPSSSLPPALPSSGLPDSSHA